MMALATAAALTAAGIPTAAQADDGDLILVGTFSGNQCKGTTTLCYADGTTANSGTLTQYKEGDDLTGVTGSPGILKADFGDGGNGDGTGTMTDFTDWITHTDGGDYILHFTYTGSEMATYIGVFQGGSGLNCDQCKNTYQLFYDQDGITSGTIDLSTYFGNPDAVSHVELFDHGGAVPEPATWALMLLGFAGVGAAMRRSRKRQTGLMQIA
jgi:hypothetical protein